MLNFTQVYVSSLDFVVVVVVVEEKEPRTCVIGTYIGITYLCRITFAVICCFKNNLTDVLPFQVIYSYSLMFLILVYALWAKV